MSELSNKEDLVLIVGGGPAGLGAALAFSNNNYKNIVVLESRSDFNFDIENSFPVGVNVRGQNAIKDLFGKSDKVPEVSSFGLKIDQWKIIVGPGINVANFDSGLVYGTSRAQVTNLLYDEVKRRPEIKVLFDHKAKNVDLRTKSLQCETSSGEQKEFRSSCLIVADGYKSRIRDLISSNDKSLKIEQWPWNINFRVLVSDPEPKTTLDEKIHYIKNSIYIAKLVTGRWAAVIGIKEKSPKCLLSTDPSDENVDELIKYLKKMAPETTQLFTREQYKSYFNRTIFTGSVTKVSKLLINNWALLLGDAAHSAIPATGEGINSALEDCHVLQKSLQSAKNLTDSLIDYEKNRLQDVNALSDIAYGAARSGFKGFLQIFLLGFLRRFNLVGPSKEDYLYGKYSSVPKKYSDAVKIWQRQTALLGGPNIPNFKTTPLNYVGFLTIFLTFSSLIFLPFLLRDKI